jgi:peroxiredoxin
MASPVYASDLKIGEPAPDFTATDIYGKAFNLENHKGEIVVLEWTNHDCPFVKKHYSTGNMQATQKTATEKGVTWVSIVSSAAGNQGNVTPEQAQAIVKEVEARATTRILDPSGEIGHLYEAKTTPHMFVIDKSGILAYAGAIDDQPSPNPKTVEGAENYVLKAISELEKGDKVTMPSSVPYGCSVKY